MGAKPGSHNNTYPRTGRGFGKKTTIHKIQDGTYALPPPMKALTPAIPPMEQELRKIHTISKQGRFYTCSHCGKHYATANSDQSARLAHEYHLDSVKEAIERAQAGESNLLEEGETV